MGSTRRTAFLLAVLATSCGAGSFGAGAASARSGGESVLPATGPTARAEARVGDAAVLETGISAAELELARARRDLVMPRLWTDLPDPLGERMREFASAAMHGLGRPRPVAAPAKEYGAGWITRSEALSGGPALELTIAESLEAALEHNLDVQIARLSRDAAASDVDLARAKFHPVVGASLVESENETDSTRSQRMTAFVAEEIPTGGSLSVSGDLLRDRTSATGVPVEETHDAAVTVSLVQPLLRGGRVYVARQLVRNAEFDRAIEEARLRAQTLRVISDTKSAYYNTILSEKIIDVTSEAIDRDLALIEASEALFEAGLVTKRDVFSARIILAEDRARLASAEADLELARNEFLDVLGLPIDSRVELVDKDIDFEPLDTDLERWITTALDSRPEVLEIRQLLERSQLDVRVAGNARQPQLDMVAEYGRTRVAPTRRSALELDRFTWSAGVVFSIPIGNAAARASARRARLERQQLDRILRQTERQIELEIRSSEIKLRSSLERMDALTMGVEQARGKLEIAKERFALGLATNLDITDAQEDLLRAETDRLRAIVDYNIGLAELEARIAGPTS